MSDDYKLIYPIKSFKDALDDNVRYDGRKFNAYRPLTITTGSFTNAKGSSCVKIGNTNIACGVRAEFAKPNPGSPSKGYVVSNVDMSFLSTSAKPKLRMTSDMINSLIYNILVDQSVIKLEQLCIQRKKLVWVLFIDIICLEIDGGLLSTAMIACIAALKDLKLPKVIYDTDTDKIEIDDDFHKLSLGRSPTLSTYSIFEEKVLMDPSAEEEHIAHSQVAIGVVNDSIGLFIKSGGEPVHIDQLNSCIVDAARRDVEVTSIINTVTNDI
ncbi:exosome complex component RRP43-like isoform X1 [Teleopsis dalmanni]|uniref:exosome complex component RRP43-like isoform X1 n=1 Tax=Teleopsis dalmanni TaxID=139649 RepID=UPI000D32D302|nr:exosome complex component RRP43-like isoform X1 [Teleopsis dalmanni]